MPPPPQGDPGEFDQISCPRGAGFTYTNSGAQGSDRGWEVAKIQQTGLILTQNRFFGIHTECETEFAFSFKNSEVCSNAL